MVCIAALILLSVVLTGSAGKPGGRYDRAEPAVLGMCLSSPNNSLTMSAAPGHRSGQAGDLLNLMRVLGTSLRLAGASAVLS